MKHLSLQSNALIWLTLLLILDRLSKVIALKLPAEGVLIWPEFKLETVINNNISFSLPLPNFLAATLAFIIIVMLIFYLIKAKPYLKQTWPVLLIIVGAVSNLADRFLYGGVIDFINLSFFTIFNLADIYITVGFIGLIWQLHKKNSKRRLLN